MRCNRGCQVGRCKPRGHPRRVDIRFVADCVGDRTTSFVLVARRLASRLRTLKVGSDPLGDTGTVGSICLRACSLLPEGLQIGLYSLSTRRDCKSLRACRAEFAARTGDVRCRPTRYNHCFNWFRHGESAMNFPHRLMGANGLAAILICFTAHAAELPTSTPAAEGLSEEKLQKCTRS